MIDWPRDRLMSALLMGENLALVTRRQSPAAQEWTYAWITDTIALDGLIRSDNRGSESVFPLFATPPPSAAGHAPGTRPQADATPSMAQQANASTQAFEDFYFRVCTLDYSKMEKAVAPLVDLMNATDQVRIVGPGTEFEFSIKDIGAVPCIGKRNIPDGECFSCPVKDSANGVVQYNTSSLYQGTVFKDVRYVVKNGKIVEAEAGAQTEKLNEILDTDEGARYFGEWSLGFNPYVLDPMLDTLFDEKIAGSFHLTPGNAYPPPGGNGNKSAIHWDKVVIQRPEYGGGEIWFDGKLIRKDGLFVVPQLEGLNPASLA